MKPNQINALKEMEVIRKALVKSTFNDLSKIINLLQRAQLLCQEAPLINLIKMDGTTFTNIEERQLLLSNLERESNELRYTNEKGFEYYKFQITCTIVMLMISISGKGLPDIEKILYK